MKKKKCNYIILIFLMLVISAFSMKTFASYITRIYASSKGEVATFSVTENISDIPIDIGSLDGFNDVSYTFKVTNKSNDKITETNYKYRLSIITSGNIPLTFTLTSDSSVNLLNDSLTADYINMSYESLEEKAYTLNISLSDSSYINSNLIEYVDLHFEAVQID